MVVPRKFNDLLGLFWVFMASSMLVAQDDLSLNKEHMSGVVEAHLASLEGWRIADVLIRVSSNGR